MDDVAYRFGELWLKQLRLDVNSPGAEVLEGWIRAEREHLEHLGRAMVADGTSASYGRGAGECSGLYTDQWERLR